MARACNRLLMLGGTTSLASSVAQPTMRAILDDVAAFAGALAGPRSAIDIHCPDVAVYPAAEAAVFRILLNLAINAVRATNDGGGGRIRITVEPAADVTTVEVANDGIGLLSAPCTVKPRPARSGLGLLIAESLAFDLGGSLTLRPSRPMTTAFVLVLPSSVTAAGS